MNMNQYRTENQQRFPRLSLASSSSNAAAASPNEMDQRVPDLNICYHHRQTDSFVAPHHQNTPSTISTIRLFGANLTVDNPPPPMFVQPQQQQEVPMTWINLRTGNVLSADFHNNNMAGGIYLPFDVQNYFQEESLNQYGSYFNGNHYYYQPQNANAVPQYYSLINYRVSPTTGAVTTIRILVPLLPPTAAEAAAAGHIANYYQPSAGTTSQQNHLSGHWIPSFARTGSSFDRNIQRILTSTSPELRLQRRMLRDQIHSIVQHERNHGYLESPLILEYSIAMALLDAQENLDLLSDSDEWPDEVGHIEQEFLTRIRLENFHSSEETEMCPICQADFEDGERIAVTKCRHDFHLDCIKEWLIMKNICPVCRQTAINVED